MKNVQFANRIRTTSDNLLCTGLIKINLKGETETDSKSKQ